MQLKRIIAFILPLLLSSLIHAKAPYVVHAASPGVVLHSSVYGEIISPVRGTDVYKVDSFFLYDERYFIKIKDTKTREIFEFSGKASLSTGDIVNIQKYRFWKNFLSIIEKPITDMGFDTSPVYTSQCVTHKGDEESQHKHDIQLSNDIALQVEEAIKTSGYDTKNINIKRVYAEDSTYSYEVQNVQKRNYAFVIYTIGNDGEVTNHNLIMRRNDNRVIPDNIEFLKLHEYQSLRLNFFTMIDKNDDSQTGYLIVFDPTNLYRCENEEYQRVVDWDIIEKKLTYQGNYDRIIILK